jgi:hypothetical protein
MNIKTQLRMHCIRNLSYKNIRNMNFEQLINTIESTHVQLSSQAVKQELFTN